MAGVRQRLRAFLAGAPLPAGRPELVVLAVDEAVANIIRHAYDGSPDRPIRLRADLGPRRLRIRLRDYGRTVAGDGPQGRPLDRPAPGGLGMHLIRCAFPEVRFRPRARGTLLDLRLPIGPEHGACVPPTGPVANGPT